MAEDGNTACLDIEAPNSGAAAAGKSGKQAEGESGTYREVTIRLPRRLFERLAAHQLKTGMPKALILKNLIADHIPNYVIQERANGSMPRISAATPDGPVNPSVEEMPMGETLTVSPGEKANRRAGKGRGAA